MSLLTYPHEAVPDRLRRTIGLALILVLVWAVTPSFLGYEGEVGIGGEDLTVYMYDEEAFEEETRKNWSGKSPEFGNGFYDLVYNSGFYPYTGATGVAEPSYSEEGRVKSVDVYLRNDHASAYIFLAASHEYYHYKLWMEEPGIPDEGHHEVMKERGWYTPMPWNLQPISFKILPKTL